MYIRFVIGHEYATERLLNGKILTASQFKCLWSTSFGRILEKSFEKGLQV